MGLHKAIKKIFKKKISYHICGKNNVYPKQINGLKLLICGNNNHVEIHPNTTIHGEILIYGHDNFIRLGNIHGTLNLYLGTNDCDIKNARLEIGDKTSSNGTAIRLGEDNSVVSIGNSCMFSWGIQIWASDTHSIINKAKTPINLGQSIKIGNHVWVGADCKIGKNTQIADNSIVGWGSIVTKKFTEEGIIIAGNPAKIVKHEINWDVRRPNQYLADTKK